MEIIQNKERIIFTKSERERIMDVLNEILPKLTEDEKAGILDLYTELAGELDEYSVSILESMKKAIAQEMISISGIDMYNYYTLAINNLLEENDVSTIISVGCGVMGAELRELAKKIGDDHMIYGCDPRYTGDVSKFSANISVSQIPFHITDDLDDVILVSNNFCAGNFEGAYEMVEACIYRDIPFYFVFCDCPSDEKEKILDLARGNAAIGCTYDELGSKHEIVSNILRRKVKCKYSL